MNRFIVFCLTAFFSVQALAECDPTGCANVYLEKLYVNSSGIIYIATSGDETKMTCKAVSNVYSTLNISDLGANAIYSTLLAAQLSNKLVSIRTDESSTNCKILYVTLDKQ